MNWKKVSDELPPYDRWLWVVTRTGIPRVCKWQRRADGGSQFSLHSTSRVTHWALVEFPDEPSAPPESRKHQ